MLQVKIVKGLRDERDGVDIVVTEEELSQRHQVGEHGTGDLVDVIVRHVQPKERRKGAKDAAREFGHVVVAEVHVPDREEVGEHTPVNLVESVVAEVERVKFVKFRERLSRDMLQSVVREIGDFHPRELEGNIG